MANQKENDRINERKMRQEDRRDDRRDNVTGDVGSLGFVGFEEDYETDEGVINEDTINPEVSNEVETFQDEYDDKKENK